MSSNLNIFFYNFGHLLFHPRLLKNKCINSYEVRLLVNTFLELNRKMPEKKEKKKDTSNHQTRFFYIHLMLRTQISSKRDTPKKQEF